MVAEEIVAMQKPQGKEAKQSRTLKLFSVFQFLLISRK